MFRNPSTIAEAERWLEDERREGRVIVLGPGVAAPIVMCKEGAVRRGLNLKTASVDFDHWCKTGLVAFAADTASHGEALLKWPPQFINSLAERRHWEEVMDMEPSEATSTDDNHFVSIRFDLTHGASGVAMRLARAFTWRYGSTGLLPENWSSRNGSLWVE